MDIWPWDEGFILGPALSLGLAMLKLLHRKCQWVETASLIFSWHCDLIIWWEHLISFGGIILLPRYSCLKLSAGPILFPWIRVLSRVMHEMGAATRQSRRQWLSERDPHSCHQIPHCIFSIFPSVLWTLLNLPRIPLLLWMMFTTFNQWTQEMNLPQVRSYAFFELLRMCLLLSVLQPTCLRILLGG